MNKKAIRIASVIIAAALLGGGIYLLFRDDTAQKIEWNKIKEYAPKPIVCEALEEAVAVDENNEIITEIPQEIADEMTSQVQEFSENYDNSVAWLYIPDTNIDYPIMQSGDNDYYAHRATDGSYLYAGSLFMDYRCNADFSDFNSVIYGHNMGNGTMFADLCKYESEDFYQEHKTIRFDTLSGFGEYEIVAVFKTVAYSEQGFKYYHFTRAESAEDFDAYITQCKALSLYDTGVTAEYDDKLITLSTCEYSRKNGRMVVVAKRIAAPSAEVGSDEA